MRGRKSYNIRNVEAHFISLENTFRLQEKQMYPNPEQFPNNVGRHIIFQTNKLQIEPSEQQRQNEFINAKFGVSKYASNLVSGKKFKHI